MRQTGIVQEARKLKYSSRTERFWCYYGTEWQAGWWQARFPPPGICTQYDSLLLNVERTMNMEGKLLPDYAVIRDTTVEDWKEPNACCGEHHAQEMTGSL